MYRARFLLAALIVLLWSTSLALPVMTDGPDSTYHGTLILMLGWMGLFVFQFAWLANILLMPALGLLLVERPPRTASKILGGLLLALFVSALAWDEMYYDNGTRPILSYHSGYFLWLGAVAVAAVSLFARARFNHEENP
jgi:hypothetical protein